MSEFTLERHGFPEHNHQQELAHGWVATLAETMVAFGGEGLRQVERTLQTDLANTEDLLRAMCLDDLLLKPGDVAGSVFYATYYDNDMPQNKLGLWHGNSFIIPPAPTRIFVTALDHPTDNGVGVQCLGIGLEYKRGEALYKQVVGMVAQPDRSVEALRLVHGVTGGRDIIEEEYTRPQGFVETREFVACMEDIFAVMRHKS